MSFINTGTAETPSQNLSPVKNVILLIGDGMGFNHTKFASYVEYGDDHSLFLQNTSFIQSRIETSADDVKITDSAASATAIATGVKTTHYYLGVDPAGNNLETILEYAESKNKVTGIITTARLTHATPAAFASHLKNRDNEDDISSQMINAGIEVMLGGGSIMNRPTAKTLNNLGYTDVKDKSSLLNLNPDNIEKLYGTFSEETFDDHLRFEADLNFTNQVRLSDMVTVGLDVLDNSNEGMFLMIEGARIDHAGHEKNSTRNALETIEFDRVVKLVYEWVQNNPNTLVITVADHETGGLDILDVSGLDNMLPNPNDSEELKRERRLERINQISTSWLTEGHRAYSVPFITFGQNSESLVDPSCEYSNNHVYSVMRNAFDGIAQNGCPPALSVSTTTTVSSSITVSSDTTTALTSTASSSAVQVNDKTTSSNTNDSSIEYGMIMLALITTYHGLKKNKK